MKRNIKPSGENHSLNTEQLLTISSIFKSASNASRSNDYLSTKIVEIFSTQNNLKHFIKEFQSCLQHILLSTLNDSKINNLLEFVTLCSMKINKYDLLNCSQQTFKEDEEEKVVGNFLIHIFDYLISIQYAKSYCCRLRMCQLIGTIINEFQNEIDNDVSEKLVEFLLIKIKDKNVHVRVEATKSLQRFQDPSDSQCPVIQAYLLHLKKDPSEDLRRTILKVVVKCQKTLPNILNAIEDDKPSVRKSAFLILAKINIRSFSIKQRVQLLKKCLTDPDESIRKSCSEILFANWLSLCDNNILLFLKKLDIEQNQEIADLVMMRLLRERSTSEFINQLLSLQDENVIIQTKLTPESAFFWRVICIYQFEHVNEELNQILPEWTPYCQYLQKWFLSNKENFQDIQNPSIFILKQLIEISMLFDRSDEMGRNTMRRTLCEFLQDDLLPESLIKICIKALAFVELNINSLIQSITEIVSEILKPLKPVNEENMNDVLKNEYDILDNELKEERSDMPTLCKVCVIIISLLQMPNLNFNTPSLELLVKNFMDRKFQTNIHFNNLILQMRVLYCFLDEKMAQELFLNFMEAIASPEIEICIVTLKCVFDLLCRYGPECFGFEPGSLDKCITNANDNNNEKIKKENSIFDEDDEKIDNKYFVNDSCSETDSFSKSSSISQNIISPLVDLLDCEIDDVRYLVAHGFMKLLYNSKLNSKTILNKLIILFFNPNTDPVWFEHIKVFLNGYIERCPWGQETLQDSLIPVLRVINSAPPSSPLFLVDLEQVLNLFLNLTDPKRMETSYENINCHNTLAIRILDEMITIENTKLIRILLRSLKKLNLDLTNANFRRDIIKQIQKVLEEIFEEYIVKELGKLLRIILSHEQKDKLSTSCRKKIINSISHSMNNSIESNEDNHSTRISSQEQKQKSRRRLKLSDHDDDDNNEIYAEDSDPEGTRINYSISISKQIISESSNEDED